MNRVNYFLLIGFLLWIPCLLWGQESPAPTAATNVKVLAESFEIPQLNRSRRIWVYLPPDYDTTTVRYPVLYMQDGQNLFDEAIAWMGNEWKVDETLNAFFAEGLEGLIVVAVEHGEEHRGQEYAPWVRDVNGKKEGGEGDEYAEFLVKTLKPFVDNNLRTKPEREHTGIAGSSLGGLVSFYAAMKYPDVFSKVGVISPAFWYNPEIIEYAEKQPYTKDTKFYFVTSEEEGDGMIGRVNAVYESLLAKGHSKDHVKQVLTATGAHDEIYFGKRFPELYKWLYNPQPRPAEQDSDTDTDTDTDPDPEPDPVDPAEPTGLEEIDATKAGILLFPNPVQHQFQLKLPDTWKGKAQGYFIDLQGRILSPQHPLQHETMISVANLPQGLFFLVVETNTQRTVLRIVKE